MSFTKRSQYSLYKPGPQKTFSLLRIIRFAFVSLILYELITSLLLSTINIQSDTMLPGIQNTDKLLVLRPAYRQYCFNGLLKIPGLGQPQRGDIVVYRQVFARDYPWYLKPINSVISFFTFQKKNLITDSNFNDKLSVRRVIGLPGDTVRVKNNVVLIKPANGERFLTEFELTENRYNINFSSLPDNWNTVNNPFNSDTEEIKIENGFYFIIGDNRDFYFDSRNSGLVPVSSIKGKAVIRYWPFKRVDVL